MEYIHETHKIIYLIPTVVIIDEKTCRYEVNYDAYLRTIVVDYFYLFSNRSIMCGIIHWGPGEERTINVNTPPLITI